MATLSPGINVRRPLPAQVRPGIAVPANPTFLTTTDVVFLSITIVLSMLMYCKGIYEKGGDAIILFLSVFAPLNPFSGVAFLSASQNMPYPPMLYNAAKLTTAQLSIVGYVLYVLSTGNYRPTQKSLIAAAMWYGPFFLWASLFKDLIIRYDVNSVRIVLLSYASAVMAASYAPKVKGRFQLWLFAFGIGGMVGVAGYIFAKLGIAANVEMVYAPERGADRLYLAGRQNEISICIGAGVGAMLSVFTFAYLYLEKSYKNRQILFVLGVLTGGFLLFGALTTFATLSRGGILGLAATLAVWFAWVAWLQRTNYSRQGRSINLFYPVVGLFAVMLLMFSFPSVQKQVNAVVNAQKEQGAIGGRSTEWGDSVRFFLKHPIVGYMPGDIIEKRSYHHIEGMALSHNVFLDAARQYGILGLILYVIFFFGPTYMLVKKKGVLFSAPALISFVPIFVLLNTLSHANHKTFHTYQGMVIGLLAFEAAPAVAKHARRAVTYVRFAGLPNSQANFPRGMVPA